MKLRYFASLLLIAANACVAQAQEYNSPETGEKALGTYFATDIDSVNLQNGNLHLHIPMFSLSGREVPSSLALDYDSNAYEVRRFGSYGSYTYGYEFMQWKKNSGLPMGRLNLPTSTPSYIGDPCPSFTISTCWVDWNINITWGPPNGSRYNFVTTVRQTCTSISNGQCNGASPSGATIFDNLTLETADSEFAQLKTGTYFSSGSTPAYITLKDGTRFQVPAGGSTSPTIATTNGNFVQPNTSSQTSSTYGTPLGDYVPGTDTVGRTIAYQYAYQSGVTTETVTLQDSNGQSQTYQIVWKNIHAYNQKESYVYSGQTPLDQDVSVMDYIQLPNGKRYTFAYNSEGMVSQVTLPSGAYIRYEYDHPNCTSRGYVVRRFVSADGTSGAEKQTTYTYNWTSTSVAQCLNTTASQSFGPLLSTTVTDPVGNKLQHVFTYSIETSTITMNSSNDVLQRVDRDWSTGANSHLNSETTRLQDMVRKTQYTYDSYNNVTRQEDFDWAVQTPGSRLRYVDRTYLTSACTSSHICNRVTAEKTYTDAAVLVAETDYEYDNYTGSNALTTRSGTIPGWTSPSGTRANVTAVQQWLTGTTFLTTVQKYDVLGNKVQVTDPAGHSTTTCFTDRFSDSVNRYSFAYATRVTSPSSTAYDPACSTTPSDFYVDTTYNFNTGLVTQTTDSLNRTTTKTYDSLNRATEEDYPNGGFTKYCYNDPTPSAPCYDASGVSVRKQVKVDTAGNLGTVTMHYDGLYRETQKETADPEGTIYVDTQYDANGRKWKASNPRRAAETALWTQFSYDALNRPLVTTATDSSTVQYAYSGNQTTVTDEAGNQRRYTYDGLGHMTKVEEPNPSLATPLVTTYTYNVLGKMTGSNQGGQTRGWAFDSLGRMTSETLPESGTTSYSYAVDSANNPDGMLRTKTDARGIATTMNYGTSGGAIHQLVSRSYSDSTPTVSFTYNSQGLRSRMDDALGYVTYTYDSNTDKLTQESRTLTNVNGSFSTSYGYNIKGDSTSMTYPSGRVVNFNYATGGGCCNSRLSSVVDQTTSTTLANGMTFNAAGEALTRTLNPGSNAVNETLSYDNRMKLKQIVDAIGSTNVLDFTYSYGTSTTDTGRVLSRRDDIQPEHSMVYAYDSVYRLRQAISNDSSWDISWTFDQWGNRLTQTPRGIASGKVGNPTFSYGQLVGGYWTDNNRQNGNTYDSAGNVTNDGQHNYTFNAENQITQMDGGTATYAYDGEGRRMKKTFNGETTYTFYGPGGVISEFTTSTAIASVTAAANTDKCLYHTTDKLGSAVLVIASTGSVIENNRTLPYGEQWLAENTASTNDKKFTTYQRDQESGLDYATNRFDGSANGRFMSVDHGPIKSFRPISLNRYIYTSDDPVNFIDSTGLTAGCPPGSEATCIDVIEPAPKPPDLVIGGPSTGGSLGPNANVSTLPMTVQQAYNAAQRLQNLVKNGLYTNCDALVAFTQNLGDRNPNKKEFVRALGVLIPGTLGAQLTLTSWNSNAVVMYAGGANGFTADYQNTADDSSKGNGDQAHHFAAFFEYGFLYGFDGGAKALAFEAAEAAFKGTAMNYGDVRLGNTAMAMGAALAAGGNVSDVSAEIRGSVCSH